jgi:trans-aconitate 3-methyltransferase
MATAAPSQAPTDPTFRSYSSSQAVTYAKGRGGYPPALINFIVDCHRTTGKTGVLLDVGCGPGNATRDLSPHFDVVFGADAGEAMIKTATEIGGVTATGAPIQFRVCTAEEIDQIKELEYGSVDMITAAVAVIKSRFSIL